MPEADGLAAAAQPAAVPAFHWSDPIWRLHDRWMASPAFRHAAEAFWPTRWIARRRASQLFDLLAGFVYTQVLLACVRLRLFELLARHGSLGLAEAARQLTLSEPATERLLEAAVALRLVSRRPLQRYGLGALGAPMVDNPGLLAMVEHHAAVYRDLADPLALLRAEAPAAASGAGESFDAGLAAFWPYAGAQSPSQLGTDSVVDYSALMAASQPLVAEQVLQAYPLRHHRRLLDVGGGEGAFACAAAAHAPALDIQVFDLPGVVELARRRFERCGLAARCGVQGGDFLRDELPPGADLISLLRVVHDHDDARVMTLLAAVRRALPVGGRLLLAEPLADTPGARAMGGAYFGFYLLAMGRGQARSWERLRAMLLQSGFSKVRRLPTRMPLLTSVILATV